MRLIASCLLVVCACSSSSGDGTTAGSDVNASGDAAADGTDGGDSADSGDSTDGATTCEAAKDFKDPACIPGCAGDLACVEGEICTLNGPKFACVKAGTQSVGQPCSQDAQCSVGACLSSETDGERCAAFCEEDKDCAAGDACRLEVEVDGGGKARFCGAKPPACDLFAQDCAKAGDGCYPADEGAACLEAGTAELEAACDSGNDCVAGLICSEERCHKICNPKTNGPNPKCDLECPNRYATIEGRTDLAVCTIDD